MTGAPGCCAQSPAARGQIQIMYGFAGERRLTEWEVPWLPGYDGHGRFGSATPRIDQLQLDVYGEMMDALHQARPARPAEQMRRSGRCSGLCSQHLETMWREPDEGIWEVRGGPRHFTYSKVMAWVAFDRAVEVSSFGLAGPVDRWRRVRDEHPCRICARGFDRAWTPSSSPYGSQRARRQLTDDPAPLASCRRRRAHCRHGRCDRDAAPASMVWCPLRHRMSATTGLPAGRGRFPRLQLLACRCLLMLGRPDEARRLFERLCDLRNDVGLLAEEYDLGPVGWSATSRRLFRISRSSILQAIYRMIPNLPSSARSTVSAQPKSNSLNKMICERRSPDCEGTIRGYGEVPWPWQPHIGGCLLGP